MCPKSVFLLITIIFTNICLVLSAGGQQICEKIRPEAIARLENGTIAVFEGKNVWLALTVYETKSKSISYLSGPCPILDTYGSQMDGPIETAVTFVGHKSVTEFMGATLYFSAGKFYTFRNLRQYQVEWGTIVYLPNKGQQIDISKHQKNIQGLMSQRISAAYYDPFAQKSKFLFKNGTVLSYDFDLGAEYAVPEVTTFQDELKQYGVHDYITVGRITTAITGLVDHEWSLFLFMGDTYCKIVLDTGLTTQKCSPQPVADFFHCADIVYTSGNCQPKSGANSAVNKESVRSIDTAFTGGVVGPKGRVDTGVKPTVASSVPAFRILCPLLRNLLSLLVFMQIVCEFYAKYIVL